MLYLLASGIFLFVSLFRFDYLLDEPIIMGTLTVFISSSLAMFSVFVYYKAIIGSNVPIRFFMPSFSLGACVTALVIITLFLSIGVANVYEFRHVLKITMRDEIVESENIDATTFGDQVAIGGLYALGGPQNAGPLMALCASCIIIYCLLNRKNKSVIILFSGFMTLGAAILTASRSSLLSIIIACMFVLFYEVFTLRKKKRHMRSGSLPKYGLKAITLLVVAASFILLLAYGGFLSVLNSAFSRFSPNILAEDERLTLWISTLILVAHNPFGYGYEYVNLIQKLSNGIFPQGVFFNHNHVHNYYLTNLIENGFIGFLIWIYLYISIIITAFKNMRHFANTRYYALSAGLFAGLISSSVHFLFGSGMMRGELTYAATFWMFVSMILVISYHRRRDTVFHGMNDVQKNAEKGSVKPSTCVGVISA